MKWRIVGVLLLAVGFVAAWRLNVDRESHDETRLIIEALVAIVGVGGGLRMMFPNSED